MLFLNEFLKYEMVPGKVIFDNDKNITLPPHWHDNIEICFFLRGGFIANIDGKPIPISAEDILIINSGQVHYVGKNTVGENRGVTIIVDMDFLKRMCPDLEKMEFSLTTAPEQVEAFRALFRNLYNAALLYKHALSNDEEVSPAASRELLQVSGLICLIYYMLTKHFSRRIERSSDRHSICGKNKLQETLEYINNNYTDALTLQDVAAFYGVSCEHFSRMFKKQMNMTFKEYLSRIRLSHANKLLLHTTETMLDIAMKTGFPDLRAFNRQFKEMYDMTPKECRSLLGVTPIN